MASWKKPSDNKNFLTRHMTEPPCIIPPPITRRGSVSSHISLACSSKHELRYRSDTGVQADTLYVCVIRKHDPLQSMHSPR